MHPSYHVSQSGKLVCIEGQECVPVVGRVCVNDGTMYQCATGRWTVSTATTGLQQPVMSNREAAIVSIALLIVVFVAGVIIGRITRW